MNAMVMDKEGNISDYFMGQQALSDKMLVTVGDPQKRFTEDYLRVYRYVRFTAQLGFQDNPQIDQAILSMAINTTISFERIQAEFNKILLSDHAVSGLKHLKRLQLLPHIIPGIENTYNFNQHSKYHHLDVFDHLMAAVENIPSDLTLRLAALLHDIGKPETFTIEDGEGHFYNHHKISMEMAESILIRLKYSKALINDVCQLIRRHMQLLDCDNEKSIRRFIRKLTPELVPLWLELRRADIAACKTQESQASIDSLQATLHRIMSQVPPIQIKDLAINGHDLMAMGINGPKIGEIKTLCLEYIDEFPDKNTKDQLIFYIKKHLQEEK
jgi:tRNA nucleotidyltransferase (CCA-adding enzyme)